MKPAERNYPVHDKELVEMRYALIKFRVNIRSVRTSCVAADSDEKSPPLAAHGELSFFAEYNFVVHYKPGKNKILDNALSRRPEYEPRVGLDHQIIRDEEDEGSCATCVASDLNLTNIVPESPLRTEIAAAYEDDATYFEDRVPPAFAHRRNAGRAVLSSIVSVQALPFRMMPTSDHKFSTSFMTRQSAPLKDIFGIFDHILLAAHVQVVAQVDVHLRGLLACQPSSSSEGPTAIFANARSGMELSVYGLMNKAIVHFVPVSATVTTDESAVHFVDTVFRRHEMPESIEFDPDPQFTSAFWSKLFEIVGTKLKMSTASHPEMDGQT
ncbi:Pol Polyprotein [Phytophthora megakarya]|uniref:Pol Polyprotein n=1 Tax=Phytophthora megakarya TaxID=4795 RepID=A0A225WI47_9STRA|nr:Pol Polyprotein [Phytophthora megakarya]